MKKQLLKFLLLISLFCFSVTLSFAQNAAPGANAAAAPVAPNIKPPVMQSVFWNTLLGSAWGALMGSAYAMQDKSVDFRQSLIYGTTLGGFMGYGFGIVLVIRGYSFDPTIIPESPLPKLGPRQASNFPDKPVLELQLPTTLAQGDFNVNSPWRATLSFSF
ncbi:MAG: hypothetical protein HQM12_07330 [SAR324 cluster bacterium]|nr:hypothetical protein [SAR324 cluster bacterium]